MEKRTLVIGDIHGAFRALTQLLERASVSEKDHLIFVGDYTDGWSESIQVIEFLIGFGNKISCTFLKGNHDVNVREWLSTGYIKPAWYKSGGKSTMEAYEHMAHKSRKQHLEFFKQLEDYHIDMENRLFIHAGFTSQNGPEYEKYPSVYNEDRTLWETALITADTPDTATHYPKRFRCFNEIYIGHTPTTKAGSDRPMKGGNVWNVDTGAAFTGKLTAMDICTKEYWQSDTVQHLYPGESGRN